MSLIDRAGQKKRFKWVDEAGQYECLLCNQRLYPFVRMLQHVRTAHPQPVPAVEPHELDKFIEPEVNHGQH